MEIFNLTNAEDELYSMLQNGFIDWHEYNHMMILIEYKVWID